MSAEIEKNNEVIDNEPIDTRPFEERIQIVSYTELVDLINRLEKGESISVVVKPELGQDDAFFFGVAILSEQRNGKDYAKLAALRKLRFGQTYDVELYGDSNAAVIFRKIKTIMKSLNAPIGRYNTTFAVDKDTYNKLNGITETGE